ncbi:hypothetical protein C8R47DRAFT_749441 [Mycena vitilis]|nr:hypothetical protein C8R47DRAFT_749441 [Mycena vitilis]
MSIHAIPPPSSHPIAESHLIYRFVSRLLSLPQDLWDRVKLVKVKRGMRDPSRARRWRSTTSSFAPIATSPSSLPQWRRDAAPSPRHPAFLLHPRHCFTAAASRTRHFSRTPSRHNVSPRISSIGRTTSVSVLGITVVALAARAGTATSTAPGCAGLLDDLAVAVPTAAASLPPISDTLPTTDTTRCISPNLPSPLQFLVSLPSLSQHELARRLRQLRIRSRQYRRRWSKTQYPPLPTMTQYYCRRRTVSSTSRPTTAVPHTYCLAAVPHNVQCDVEPAW